MELGRFDQINRLTEAGWYADEETQKFADLDRESRVVGGPTYLKSPDGVLCACSGNMERPVEGIFNVQGSKNRRAAVYASGRCIALQG